MPSRSVPSLERLGFLAWFGLACPRVFVRLLGAFASVSLCTLYALHASRETVRDLLLLLLLLFIILCSKVIDVVRETGNFPRTSFFVKNCPKRQDKR